MNELSLFTGAGGGILGTKLLGWKTIGYVEYEDYPQRVLAQRIKDGILDNAPIFGDIKAFIGQGYADQYSGMVDVITAGFPCQPFSVAGKGKGELDERNMWPDTLEAICRIRPQFVFLENAPSILISGHFGTIVRGLAEGGYDLRWKVLSAAELGAPHKRDRIWIVANARSLGSQICEEQIPRRPLSRIRLDSPKCPWWSTEPEPLRVGAGLAVDVDRLKAIGNGQVPAVVAKAWEILTT